MKKKLKKVANTADEVGDKVREKVFGYLLAGFGFVAGLAWNDAIKSTIDAAFPPDQDSIIAKFIYAFAVTLLVVIITIILVRVTKESEGDIKKKK